MARKDQMDLFGARSDRDRVLDVFEITRTNYLSVAREVALQLGREQPLVSVDDVREIAPPPADIDPRVMGAIFRKPDWQPVDVVNSHRRTCHARPIRRFRLVAP